MLEDGRTESCLVLDAPGDPSCACEVDVREKFHRLADPVIGKAEADALAEACRAATERDDSLALLCSTFNL